MNQQTGHSFNSLNFKIEFFEDMIISCGENTRLDFKFKLYETGKNEDDKYKFIRHIIAFANIARRTNLPCWMVFGIDENNKENPQDVRDQYPSKDPPKGWFNPNVSMQTKQTDGVLEVYRKVAKEWIDPYEPNLHLEHGVWREKFVSYLTIEPTNSSKPFCLKKPTPGKENNELCISNGRPPFVSL